MCMLSVSNVIYHKLSHGAAFYTLNGKNVNVMLEFQTKQGRFVRARDQYGIVSCFVLFNSLTTRKQMKKFLSANFQKMLSPSYIVLSIQSLEGKQCRSR